jgi:hypothetical protein
MLRTGWVQGAAAVAMSLAFAGCLSRGRSETASDFVHSIRYSRTERALEEPGDAERRGPFWKRLLHRSEGGPVALPLSEGEDEADPIPGDNPAAELIDDF